MKKKRSLPNTNQRQQRNWTKTRKVSVVFASQCNHSSWLSHDNTGSGQYEQWI